jgi:hypothetical protein
MQKIHFVAFCGKNFGMDDEVAAHIWTTSIKSQDGTPQKFGGILRCNYPNFRWKLVPAVLEALNMTKADLYAHLMEEGADGAKEEAGVGKRNITRSCDHPPLIFSKPFFPKEHSPTQDQEHYHEQPLEDVHESQKRAAAAAAAAAAEALAQAITYADAIKQRAENALSKVHQNKQDPLRLVDSLTDDGDPIPHCIRELRDTKEKKVPPIVKRVMAALMIVLEREFKAHSWAHVKQCLLKDALFVHKLRQHDDSDDDAQMLLHLEPIVQDPQFIPEKVPTRAGSILCAWIISKYKGMVDRAAVEPEIQALKNAQTAVAAARMEVDRLAAGSR